MVENELPFLSWDEFQQMAPSILQLEVTRLSALIGASQGRADLHNLMVRARFELKRFIACLREADRTSAAAACAPHLQAALLNVSLANADPDEAANGTLTYVADRLKYVHDRMPLIY